MATTQELQQDEAGVHGKCEQAERDREAARARAALRTVPVGLGRTLLRVRVHGTSGAVSFE
jgi:hypothetical protein